MPARPNDLMRFSLVIPGNRKISGETFKGRKVMIPNGVKLDYQRTRDGQISSINVDGIGLVFVDPKRIKDDWLTPINRYALMWREAARCGGKWEDQAYTQENASKPFHSDKLWYDK